MVFGQLKAHLLSFLEYRTSAVYHATRDILNRLDHVQCKFLKDVGVDEVTALVEFNLAPLAVRRDIAMLGLIHRTALGKGPPQFAEYFRRCGSSKHKFSMHDPRTDCKASLIKRSALGLVAIYNLLPPDLVSTKSVLRFQKYLPLPPQVDRDAFTASPAAYTSSSVFCLTLPLSSLTACEGVGPRP